METEDRLEVSGDLGVEGSGKLLLHRCRVSFWGVENVLEPDGEWLCNTMNVLKSPWIVYFKVVKMVNFGSCEFYFNYKEIFFFKEI